MDTDVVTMSRTVPIRVRTGVADAVAELAGEEGSVSDLASFLLIVTILGNKSIYEKLTPRRQVAISAEVVDLFGDAIKLVAAGMKRDQQTLDDLLKDLKLK